jgi:hypothetical protein
MASKSIALGTGLLTRFQPSVVGTPVFVQFMNSSIGVVAIRGAPVRSIMKACVPPEVLPAQQAKPWPAVSGVNNPSTPIKPSLMAGSMFVSSYRRMLGQKFAPGCQLPSGVS